MPAGAQVLSLAQQLAEGGTVWSGAKRERSFFSPHFQSRLKVCLCRVENVISNISLSAKWYHAGSTTAGEEKKNLRPVVSLMESVPTLARFCMTTGALKIHLQRRPVSRCHDILSVLLHVLIEAFRWRTNQSGVYNIQISSPRYGLPIQVFQTTQINTFLQFIFQTRMLYFISQWSDCCLQRSKLLKEKTSDDTFQTSDTVTVYWYCFKSQLLFPPFSISESYSFAVFSFPVCVARAKKDLERTEPSCAFLKKKNYWSCTFPKKENMYCQLIKLASAHFNCQPKTCQILNWAQISFVGLSFKHKYH